MDCTESEKELVFLDRGFFLNKSFVDLTGLNSYAQQQEQTTQRKLKS